MGAHAGDTVTAEGFNDSVFDETLVINDATPTSYKITAPEGQRHDGTPGTGVRIEANGVRQIFVNVTVDDVIIEWIAIDGNGQDVDQGFNIQGTVTSGVIVRNCLAYNFRSLTIGTASGFIIPTPSHGDFLNNMAFNIYKVNEFNGSAVGIQAFTSGDATISNNTVQNIQLTDAAANNGRSNAFYVFDSGQVLKNNVGMDMLNATATGNDDDFVFSTSTHDFNMSSDTTADGASSLISKSSVNQFVSVSVGDENLHLKFGADAIDAGTDLGNTNGVNIDIDGFDRDADASRDPWDMGSHQADQSLFADGKTGGRPLIIRVI